MTVAEERLLQFVSEGPCALQVTQVRLEVLPVVSHGVVLILPRFEPCLHLCDLVCDFVILEHFRWDFWEGNVLDLVIVGGRCARHTEAVVVVARAELDSVEDHDDLTESDGADVVGVVVHRGDGRTRVRGRVVGPSALEVMSQLRTSKAVS